MNIVIYSNYQYIHNYKYFENPNLLPISTSNSPNINIYSI